MKCPKCGYARNAEGAVLCNLCGDVLPQAQAATTVTPPATPPAPARGGGKPAAATPVAPAGPTDVYRTSYAGSMPTDVPAAAPAATPPPERTSDIPTAMEGGVCHLKCSLLDRPLRLRPDRPVQIGRGGDNDIVIPSQMVSRKHGKVFFENRVWVYEDNGSSNGSRVNGKRVDRVVLQGGDVIDLGGFLITYKEIHDLSDVSDGGVGAEEGKTMALDANMLKKVALQGLDGVALLGGMGGSLADISIPDILQLMEMQRKSGTLTLDFEGARGKIFLEGGNAIHAEYGKFTGESAIFRMLKIHAGSFHFDPREPKVAATIGRPTTSILLDASREMDEGSR